MIARLTRSIFISSKCLSTIRLRTISSTPHHRPMMLMDLPHIAYPNVFYMIRNFFSRLIVSTYFDSTFAIQPFCEGARQALTVVSQLIGNEQFDDLHTFARREVVNEVRENYQHLSAQQKQQIPVEESEIIFTYPYLIGMILDEQTKSRMVEITMIFHVLKNPQAYREEMEQNPDKSLINWASTVKKMRDNIIVCNYQFLRDMSKNASDDSWIITGLNHWSPNEYFQQQQQQQQQQG